MVNAQEYIEENFDKVTTKIHIPEKNLEGKLDLSEYPHLEYLFIDSNPITDLNLTNNKKLNFFTASSTNLEKTMEIFKDNINLEYLAVANTSFYGSLESLKTHLKLKKLNIYNTKISEGFEYLPDNVIEIDIRHTYDGVNDWLKGQDLLEWRNENLRRKIKELQFQLKDLSSTINPNNPYNFTELKQEITRLKYQELAPQVRNKKAEFEQRLITKAKNKVGSHFEKTVDLLLEAQKQISGSKQNNDQLFQAHLEGQLDAYQNILENDLTKEEIQTLLNKQTELLKLEEHLENLQQNLELQAQIQQT